jgi:cell division septal protein FtsQ
MGLNRRRRKNEYLLDVKVHTEARTRERVRWVSALVAAAAVIGLVGFGMWRFAKFAADKLVFENPRFALTDVSVVNDGGMTTEQVLRLAGVKVGMNAFAVELDQVQRNLELIPQVQRVEVRRMLPHRLQIRLSERVAVARLQPASRDVGTATFFVDRTGVVMKPLKFTDGTVIAPATPATMPVLTGVATADLRVGQRVESEQVLRALALVNQLDQMAAGALVDVQQIDVSKPRHLTVTGRQGMHVRFDVAEFTPQLRRLSAVLVWAQQRQRTVASVDLTVDRGVPVMFTN